MRTAALLVLLAPIRLCGGVGAEPWEETGDRWWDSGRRDTAVSGDAWITYPNNGAQFVQGDTVELTGGIDTWGADPTFTFYLNDAVLCTGPGNGDVDCTVTIPDVSPGTYDLRLQGRSSAAPTASDSRDIVIVGRDEPDPGSLQVNIAFPTPSSAVSGSTPVPLIALVTGPHPLVGAQVSWTVDGSARDELSATTNSEGLATSAILLPPGPHEAEASVLSDGQTARVLTRFTVLED